MSKKLPIYEVFHTWQGEGVYLGRNAFFIRTFGCPVQCAWCDSAGTWHTHYTPAPGEMFLAEPEELAEMARRSGAPFVVITGGEPSIHDLTGLTTEIRGKGMRSHIETSGSFPLRGHFDWVTVSPKWAKLPLREVLARADELKIIVEDEDSIHAWMSLLGDLIPNGIPIWLHPEWSQHKNPEVLRSISETVKAQSMTMWDFRAGWQLHKVYSVDALDPGSKPLIPLGGDPARGY